MVVKLSHVDGSGRSRSATVTVDGTPYVVEPGDRFGGSFKVVSIYGKCANLLFGDDQFTLCEGDEILK